MNEHKVMRILYSICQTNIKLLVTVNPRNAYKLEFYYHLCIPFTYQPQTYVVVFSIITFHIYIIL